MKIQEIEAVFGVGAALGGKGTLRDAVTERRRWLDVLRRLAWFEEEGPSVVALYIGLVTLAHALDL